MASIVWTTFAVLLTLVAVVAHELAHGLALRTLGAPTVEAGIGLPFPPRIVLPPRGWRTFRLSLSPWLLGAYVTPDPRWDRMHRMSYRDRVWYEGAGIVANVIVAGVFLALFGVIRGHWLIALGCAAVSVAVWLLRRAICSYVLPVAGLGALVVVATGLVVGFGGPVGPVGVARFLAVDSFLSALVAGGLMSLSIAVFNVIPLYPLDGGRIAGTVLDTLAGTATARRFREATAVVSLCLFLYLITADALWALLR